jgi:HAD superfamily hydrolase (TIGR01509 family)
MDGLTLDTEPTYCHAWRLAAREFGFDLSDDYCQRLFGCHSDDVELAMREVMGKAYHRELFFQSAEQHWRQYLDRHGLACMPGLKELLSWLRHSTIPYALATNSISPYAEECLQRSGVAAEFSVVVTRNQVPRGKPAPDIFLEAASRLATPPEFCLALEDSETGLAAARVAGTTPILIQRRQVLRQKLGPLALCSFASLYDLLEVLQAQSYFSDSGC